MNYNKLVESYFFEPQHIGILDSTQPRTICSRNVDFELYLAANEKGVIVQATFKANGNPYLIAGFEWVCRQLQGTAVNQHPRFNYQDLVQILEIPQSSYPTALLVEKGYCQGVEALKERLSRGQP
jgi:nitrogen fixation NifU-like protein